MDLMDYEKNLILGTWANDALLGFLLCQSKANFTLRSLQGTRAGEQESSKRRDDATSLSA